MQFYTRKAIFLRYNAYLAVGILLSILLISACQSATPVPVEPAAVSTVAATEPAAIPATAVPTTAASPTTTLPISSVAVEDQALESDHVTIAEVVSSGPGWLVIHADNQGRPGSILGFSPVAAGENAEVQVEISPAQATDTMYAMLHTDAGDEGTFEFPDGPDAPVVVDGIPVSPTFRVILEIPMDRPLTMDIYADPFLLLGSSDELGEYLTDSAGRTLYVFSEDEPGTSNCNENCAVDWPPLLLDPDQALNVSMGINGVVGMIQRDDGTLQMTYNGFPLYYRSEDNQPGDITGHGINSSWAVASPDSP